MYADPAVAESTMELGVDDALRESLSVLSRGRPLVVDCKVFHVRGVAFGDLRVAFADRPLRPRYVRIAPIDAIEILVDKRLVSIIDGGTLRAGGLPFLRHLDLVLKDPARWIEFVEQLPTANARILRDVGSRDQAGRQAT